MVKILSMTQMIPEIIGTDVTEDNKTWYNSKGEEGMLQVFVASIPQSL